MHKSSISLPSVRKARILWAAPSTSYGETSGCNQHHFRMDNQLLVTNYSSWQPSRTDSFVSGLITPFSASSVHGGSDHGRLQVGKPATPVYFFDIGLTTDLEPDQTCFQTCFLTTLIRHRKISMLVHLITLTPYKELQQTIQTSQMTPTPPTCLKKMQTILYLTKV
jgi:hypothetical protein